MFLRFTHVFTCIKLHSFLVLSSIPLCHILFTIHLLMNVWIISNGLGFGGEVGGYYE